MSDLTNDIFHNSNYNLMIAISHFSALHYLCRHGHQESTVRHEIAYKLLYAGLSADCVDNRGNEIILWPSSSDCSHVEHFKLTDTQVVLVQF